MTVKTAVGAEADSPWFDEESKCSVWTVADIGTVEVPVVGDAEVIR